MVHVADADNEDDLDANDVAEVLIQNGQAVICPDGDIFAEDE